MGGTPSLGHRDDDIIPGRLDGKTYGDMRRRKRGGNRNTDDKIPTPSMHSFDPDKNMLIQNLGQVFDIVEDPSEGANRNQNYGVIPLNVLHQIMLFSRLKELVSISLTCKLFYNAHNSRFFWKSYYREYFSSSDEDIINEVSESSNVNWKKQFFKRYYLYSDEFYRRKYKMIENMKNENVDTVIKITLCGDTEIGKSCFLQRCKPPPKNTFLEHTKQTIGVEFTSTAFEYDTKRKQKKGYVKAQIWDTSGQLRFRAITRSYYRGSNAIMVFFGIDNLESFKNVDLFVTDLKENIFSRKDTEKCAIIIVGTKSDLCDLREVFYEEHVEPYLKEKSNEMRLYYVETSAKENRNIFKALGMCLDAGIGHKKWEAKFGFSERDFDAVK